jgi:hypothetical protein
MPREIGFSSETDLITRRRVFTVREVAAWWQLRPRKGNFSSH